MVEMQQYIRKLNNNTSKMQNKSQSPFHNVKLWPVEFDMDM